MTVSMTIVGEDENDFRRQLMRLAVPYLEGFADAGGFNEPEPEATEPPPPPPSTSDAAPETPRKGRPKGSTNKPKTNGSGAEPPPPQTEAQPANGALVEAMPLAEQIQIITDAAHDQPEKFKPLLVPLREKLGVQYVSKALEKDRPVLQAFINEHGLAV
jgi:hypothetical protein